MDDTPDKLRRNAVVLSAAILVIALFHLSFKTTGTLLGFAEIGNVSAFKVWLALTATLFYMYLRWRYAADTQAELLDVIGLFSALRTGAIKQQIASNLRTHLTNGRPVTVLLKPAEFLDEALIERLGSHGRASQVGLSVSLRQMTDSDPWWTGRAGIGLFVEWPNGQRYGRNGGNMLEFSLNRRLRVLILIVSAWRAATASRIGVDIAVPFGLTAIAALTCLYQLAFFVPI
jgi:hypothetical protein